MPLRKRQFFTPTMHFNKASKLKPLPGLQPPLSLVAERSVRHLRGMWEGRPLRMAADILTSLQRASPLRLKGFKLK